jgi:hypothetical protein
MSDGAPFEQTQDDVVVIKSDEEFPVDFNDVSEDGFYIVPGTLTDIKPNDYVLINDVEMGKGLGQFVRQEDGYFLLKVDFEKWDKVNWAKTPDDLERLNQVRDDTDLTLAELKRLWAEGESVEVVTPETLKQTGNESHTNRAYLRRGDGPVGPVDPVVKVGDVILVYDSTNQTQRAARVAEIDMNLMATIEEFL